MHDEIIMKTLFKWKFHPEPIWVGTLCVALAGLVQGRAELDVVQETATEGGGSTEIQVNKELRVVKETQTEPGKSQVDFLLKELKPVSLKAKGLAPTEVPWLGIHTEEAPEVIAAQLELAPGAGLVVQYVTPESPAAKGGLQKNDVLAQWEDQWLVHPEQLRKLVQYRKEGDTVALKYYRGGKMSQVSVVLGKNKASEGSWPGIEGGADVWRFLGSGDPWPAIPRSEELRVKLDKIKESMGRLKIDEKKLENEIQRSMESAQKALTEALGRMTNVEPALDKTRRNLEKLIQSNIAVSQDARVTVKSDQRGVQSLVHADDDGTYVIVANPRKRLTAHDKQGTLLFDGEIESPEQRSRLPDELKAKVDSLLEMMPSQGR